jgi:signal transduction histidine kinase
LPSGEARFAYPSQLKGTSFLEENNIKKNKTEQEKPLDHKSMNEKEHLFELLIHDLTSPLSIASTSTANLLHKAERYGPLTDFQKKILDRILRNVHKAQTLLQEMIEIFRSEEGIFQKQFFSIEMILRESLLDVLEVSFPTVAETLHGTTNLRDFQQLLEPHGIFLEITGRYCKSSFCHDPAKIQQILRNLLSNAVKYRRKRVDVSISGEMNLHILVGDDGIGIPLEEQEAIFERFVRLNDEKRPYVPGLGLGLTGVKALIEAMKGEITIVSHEGGGTRFTVNIPPLQHG